MKTLQELSDHIAAVWKCDPSRYPELAGMTGAQRKNFLLKHSVLHITKTAGKIAAVCENFDHTQGQENGDDELKVLAVKMFVNAMKLAEESGVSADELLEKAANYIK